MRSAAPETLNNSALPISTFFSYTIFSHSFTNKNIVPWHTETYVANSVEHRIAFGQETVIEIGIYRLASKCTGNSARKALHALSSVVLMILWPPRNGILEIFGSRTYVYKRNCGWEWGNTQDPYPTTLKRESPLSFWFSSSADTLNNSTGVMWRQKGKRVESEMDKIKFITRDGTLIVAIIYLQLIQNRYMVRNFTVLQCSHQNCVQPVASDVEVVGYL